MDQELINWAFSALGALGGFTLKNLFDALRDLQHEDQKLADKVSQIEVLVAGNYVKREEFERTMFRLFEKLDTIEEKIAGKVDR